MTAENTYIVNPGWRLILRDLGLRPVDVLGRAQLRDDLFGREAEETLWEVSNNA